MSLDFAKIFLSLLLFAFAINASAATAGVKIKIPCSQLKTAPYYTEYGIATPKASTGWKCTAIVESGTLRDMKAYLWTKKGESTISLVGVPMEALTFSPKEMKKLVDNPKELQPLLSIRNFINVFLADPNYSTNDERIKLIDEFISRPKAVFFNRGNSIIMVYYNKTPGLITVGKPFTKKDQKQRVMLFRYDPKYSKMFLDVRCDACLFDNIFNLVVNPVLQNTGY